MAWLAGVTDLLVCLDGTATPVEAELWPELFMAGGQNLAEVLLNMKQAMEELGEAPVMATLGGGITGAQNEGRLTAAVHAEIPGAVYADEVRDANRCGPCGLIDERYLGSTDEMDQVRQHYPGGGFGGYIGCKGRERCRGTIRFEWPEGLDPVEPPPLLQPGEQPPPSMDDLEAELEQALQQQIADNAAQARVDDRSADIERSVKRQERKAAKVEPAKVPKVDDHDDEHTAKVADLRRLIAREGEATREDQRRRFSGYQGVTELVLLDDGGRLISKRLVSHDGDTDEEDVMYATADTDKEELANMVARAVGVEVPALVRAGPTHLYMEFVQGPVGGSLKAEDRQAVIDSDAGNLMGVLDVLVANTDRNKGNWLVRDGRPVAIDHGYAWNETVEPVTTSPFAAPMVDLGERDRFGTSPAPVMRDQHPISKADLALIRERVAQLRPDFDRLGRGDWYDRMEARLTQLEQTAVGTRDRIPR